MSGKSLVVDVVALVVAMAAGVISILALRASDEAAASAARTEIAEYATRMVELDRLADERNDTQISVLAEQAYSVIMQYGQGRLRLAPSTFRVLATYSE